jgi:diguanylate cyclase (GGDEF)-like protein
MSETHKDSSEQRAPELPLTAADQLLRAINIEPGKLELKVSAAFRALAEEVLHLRARVTDLEAGLVAAEALADRDVLCPVLNRRAFERELSREISLARRHETSLCLIYLDLDDFKLVNDRFGHACGDEMLKRVCDIVRGQVRQSDIVGRLGGDEFAVILSHAELGDCQIKADLIHEEIAALTVTRGKAAQHAPVGMGASCGIVQWSGQRSSELLIAQADEAMYRAKAARKSGRA